MGVKGENKDLYTERQQKTYRDIPLDKLISQRK